MGLGIALSYSFSGVSVLLVDLKQRSEPLRRELVENSTATLRSDLEFLADTQLMDRENIEDVLSRIHFSHRDVKDNGISQCSIVYEAVPEVIELKAEALEYLNTAIAPSTIVASTTSTFVITTLAKLIDHPGRFANAHWLNPAHLMPLIEISRDDITEQNTVDQLIASLEAIGKVPIVCSASPGYIVPRIQALAMNEAARLVEEGVASAEDVDKAVKYGFGLRFGVLGLLEFIDWGGGDILYYASKYLSEAVDPRYEAPKIIASNMHGNKNGIRDGEGFFDYKNIDTTEYRQSRLKDFVAQLRLNDLLPSYKNSDANSHLGDKPE